MVVHTYNLSSQEAEEEGSLAWVQPEQQSKFKDSLRDTIETVSKGKAI